MEYIARAGFVAVIREARRHNWTRKKPRSTGSKSRRRWRIFMRAIWCIAISNPKTFGCGPTPIKPPKRCFWISASPHRGRARWAMPMAPRAQRHTQAAAAPSVTRPNRRSERRNPDARSDIHAWGMTWYHLLSGLDPTEPDELRKLRVHRLSGFRPELSDWDDLIADCIDPRTHRAPAKRERNCWNVWTS